MSESSSCPKCSGPRDRGALYCPFCGTIFSRYEDQPGSAGEPAPGQVPPEPAAPADDLSPGAPAVNPYQAPQAPVAPRQESPQASRPTPAAVEPYEEVALARRFTRLAAQILDSIIFVSPVVIHIWSLNEAPGPDFANELLTKFAIYFLVIGAINLYFLGTNGQTLGKKALGIRIVRTDGEKVGFWRLLSLRIIVPQLIAVIPILGTIFGLLDALFIFGKERRCIHDHFADTVVVMA